MFKSTCRTLAFASLIAAIPLSAHADVFTSYVDFEGVGVFDARQDVTVMELETLAGNNLDFSSDMSIADDIATDFPTGTFTLATAVFATGGALELPDINEDAVWTVSIEGFIEGNYREVGEMFPTGYGFKIDESIDSVSAGLGTFSLNEASDFLGGPIFPDTDTLTATVIALLGANDYNLLFDDTTALILSDAIADAPVAAVLSDDNNPLEEANGFLGSIGLAIPLPDLIQADGTFGGRITLTAQTRDPVGVMEPASLSLLGLGLVGLGIARRRKP